MGGYAPSIEKIQGKQIDHLANDDLGLVLRIVAHQHLSRGDAVGFALIGFDVRKQRRFASPRVIDQQFRVDAEDLVKDVLGQARDPFHGADAEFFEPLRRARTDPPEIGQGLVPPEFLAVGFFVERGDEIGRPLRHYIHRDLREVQVGTDARRRGDPAARLYFGNQEAREFERRFLIGFEVSGDVDEHLVDRVDVNIVP